MAAYRSRLLNVLERNTAKPQRAEIALGTAPDFRTRYALLHLSYSYAEQCGSVTQDPVRSRLTGGVRAYCKQQLSEFHSLFEQTNLKNMLA